jgi:hypothetical protein
VRTLAECQILKKIYLFEKYHLTVETFLTASFEFLPQIVSERKQKNARNFGGNALLYKKIHTNALPVRTRLDSVFCVKVMTQLNSQSSHEISVELVGKT